LAKDNVLKSWAVPKGIPLNSGLKRLAIKTEDHPLDYAEFQGTIPKAQYGAGTVKTWDKGYYKLKYWGENKIEITLKGRKLKGNYALIHFKKGSEKNWLLIKVGDKN
jgi:bifunctional non-homologous end joining protein LigD